MNFLVRGRFTLNFLVRGRFTLNLSITLAIIVTNLANMNKQDLHDYCCTYIAWSDFNSTFFNNLKKYLWQKIFDEDIEHIKTTANFDVGNTLLSYLFGIDMNFFEINSCVGDTHVLDNVTTYERGMLSFINRDDIPIMTYLVDCKVAKDICDCVDIKDSINCSVADVFHHSTDGTYICKELSNFIIPDKIDIEFINIDSEYFKNYTNTRICSRQRA